ncbi:MAG: cupin domain-containing protein [Chloroflexia bacterium]|nr:cupin domain-containing protein [Chloroflexia bacterium]
MSDSPSNVLDLRSIFGLTATVTTPSAATNGAYVEMDVTADPGSATLIHHHPEQEETYQVLAGALEVYRDEQWQAVAAGESLTIPPRAIHGFRNASDAPVRFMNVHRPALAFQEHLETLDRLSRAGKIRGTKDWRSLIYLSMSAIEYRPDVPVKPPRWAVQGLAFFGRRFGYTLDDGTIQDRQLDS